MPRLGVMSGSTQPVAESLFRPMTDPFGRTIRYLRVSVSLDTLDAAKFRAITRWGDIDKVLAGIEAARAAGLAVKINAVALKNMNEDEIPALMEWAHGKGMALTLIEVMPMGDIGEGRIDQYVPWSLL